MEMILFIMMQFILEKNIVDDSYKPFEKTLRNMKKLSDILRENKYKRGYIDFEIPEVKIIVDEKGKPIELSKRVQGTGEKLIEDFMIVANETVATYINNMELPFIYRIHGEPSQEKLNNFVNFVSTLGYKTVGKLKKSSPQSVQNLLNQLKDTMEYPIFSELLLRSMQKAVYSDTNIGHFGLGSDCYTHFTSPIRRYPDLILHRLVKDYNYNYSDKLINERREQIPIEAEHCSIREQEAQNCERDVDKMKKAEYMMDHIGEIYKGIISGVQEFGIFVELDNTVEGLIKVENIKGDYYIYDKDLMALVGKKNKKRYSFGDAITVKVISADKDKSQIDFEIYEEKDNKNDTKK